MKRKVNLFLVVKAVIYRVGKLRRASGMQMRLSQGRATGRNGNRINITDSRMSELLKIRQRGVSSGSPSK